jgi:non-heme chloroperoxidase
MVTAKDGTEIYYKDWGTGPAVTFSHGWPLHADAWDAQMLFLAEHGYRCIAHDRRGHGRSSQASARNDMEGYADDLAAVIDALDLQEATLVATPPAAARWRATSDGMAASASRKRF